MLTNPRFQVAKGNWYGLKHAYKHHGIALDGNAQITGATFANNYQVAQAVKALNAALQRGETSCEVIGWDGHPRTWDMAWHNQGCEVLPVNLHPDFGKYMVDGFYCCDRYPRVEPEPTTT